MRSNKSRHIFHLINDFSVILLYSSFWPGSLFYMLTVLPVIWVAELKVLNEKIAGGTQACEITTQNTVATLGNGLVCSLRLRSHGTGRIFNRLKHLTGYFAHTGPCNVFALFTLKWKTRINFNFCQWFYHLPMRRALPFTS